MKDILRIAVGVCAVAGFAVVAGTEVEARCARTSAQGDGVTKELAQGMAKINLDFAIAGKAAKSAGPVQYKCAPGMLLLTACTATQRTCT